MPNKKPRSGQSGSIKSFRSDVAKLKAKGLVSKRVDARSQRETDYMKRQVRKFRDVLEGRAKVVHTPKRSEAKKFEEAFRVKGKNVIIPVEKGERVSYRKGHIVGTRQAYGQKIQKDYLPKQITKPSDLPTGSNIIYTIPLGSGLRSFDTPEDVFIFMQPYESGKNPYRNWQRYLIIERVSGRGKRDFAEDSSFEE